MFLLLAVFVVNSRRRGERSGWQRLASACDVREGWVLQLLQGSFTRSLKFVSSNKSFRLLALAPAVATSSSIRLLLNTVLSGSSGWLHSLAETGLVQDLKNQEAAVTTRLAKLLQFPPHLLCNVTQNAEQEHGICS